MAKNLIYSVDHCDRSTVARLLAEGETTNEVDDALRLCSARREDFKIMEMLLDARPSQFVIDDLFWKAASSGVFPFTVHILAKFASVESSREMYRELRRAKQEKDYSFYFVSFIEEEKSASIFGFEIPKRLKKKQTSRILNQSWMNDMFLAEVLSDHRFISMQLMTLPVKHLRPSATTVIDAFLLLLGRGNFSFAQLLLELDEGPLDHPKDLFIGQFGMDMAFQEMIETEDVLALQFLLSRKTLRPDQQLIDNAFNTFFPNRRRTRLIQQRLNSNPLRFQQSRSRRAAEASRRFWVQFYQSLLELLQRHVAPETLNRARELEARAQRMERLAQRHRHGDIADIHGFSGATVEVGGDIDTDDQAPASPTEHEDTEDEPTDVRQPSNRKSLITAVADLLRAKCESIPGEPPTVETVEAAITALINQQFTDEEERNEALHMLTHGITGRSQQTLINAWRFLNHFHPDQVLCWLSGFLGEAVSERSCNPGVEERVVTGLRGLGDRDFDALFAQVEGPIMAQLCLSKWFNLERNSRNAADEALRAARRQTIAEFLVRKQSITASSDEEQLLEGLRQFAAERLQELQYSLTSVKDWVEASIEVIVGDYDSILKPAVLAALDRMEASERSGGAHSAAEA